MWDFFIFGLVLPNKGDGTVGVVGGGVSGLCTSEARYWQTDTAAACERECVCVFTKHKKTFATCHIK